MTTLLILDETTSHAGSDDDLDHLFCCCSPDVGLCGADLTDDEEVPEDVDVENPCVVCDDLIEIPCPRCGFGITGPCACGKREGRAA